MEIRYPMTLHHPVTQTRVQSLCCTSTCTRCKILQHTAFFFPAHTHTHLARNRRQQQIKTKEAQPKLLRHSCNIMCCDAHTHTHTHTHEISHVLYERVMSQSHVCMEHCVCATQCDICVAVRVAVCAAECVY